MTEVEINLTFNVPDSVDTSELLSKVKQRLDGILLFTTNDFTYVAPTNVNVVASNDHHFDVV